MLGEYSHWVLLVASHFLRSCLDHLGQTELKSEISILRVEVHRAKQLVSDYNSVLEACETESKYLRNSSYLGATVNISIGLVCALLWVWHFLRQSRSRQATVAVLGDSDNSEIPEVRRFGPVRPSQLIRTRS